jgi:TRAP-type uncharacterized transport system substrate-binding protein
LATRFAGLVVLVIPVVALVAALGWLLLHLAHPAPPASVTIATGNADGGYYAFAQQYARILARSGVRLEIRQTRGALENVSLLSSPSSGIDLALVQGGLTTSEATPGIVSLGRVFLEPLWIFHRLGEPLATLHQLAGRRISVGPEGSGTRKLALTLLAASGVDARNAILSSLDGRHAADALERGEVDAVFLVMAPESTLVRRLFRAPSIRLMSLAQADAYARLHPYLKHIVLPRGALDLVTDVPAAPIDLVAPVAALAARRDLHPAIAGLMIDALRQVHGKPGLFHGLQEFPRPADPELAMAPDAERYYRAGPSFLKRFLPFWMAIFIERMLVVAIPVAGVALPLAKLVPLVWRWRIKRRLYAWYDRLKRLEALIDAEASRSSPVRLAAELDRIEAGVAALQVPLAFSQDYYDLRSAVSLVRQRLGERQAD